MRRLLCPLVVLTGLILPGVAHAASLQNLAAQAGVAQTDQSFDTLVFDYNQDGISDFLYSPQNDKKGRQLWRGNPGGTFTLVTHLVGPVTTDQHGCTTADFDHNGLPDVYCAMGAIHGSRQKVNPLWLQTGAGAWTLDASSGAQDPYGRGYSATVLDANGDGWPDLFVDNYFPRPDGIPTPDRLFLNLGDDHEGNWLGFADAGSASGVEVEQGNRGCDFSTDFNGDGDPDIVFCGSPSLVFLQNNGDGTFTNVTLAKLGSTRWAAAGAKLVDLNGDGLLDLVYIRNTQEGVRLGTASGKFASSTLTHPMVAGRSVEVTDVNGDGIPDIYALQGNGQPGCLTCTTNYPDYLYLGGMATAGKYTSGAGGSGTYQTDATGSGDSVNAISINGRNDLIVGNGANLMTGPLQLWGWTP
jgi:hypothetical protein